MYVKCVAVEMKLFNRSFTKSEILSGVTGIPIRFVISEVLARVTSVSHVTFTRLRLSCLHFHWSRFDL
jgi:hypothetical protein